MVGVAMVQDWNPVELSGGSPVEVVEDASDDFGVDDESENFHPCPTVEVSKKGRPHRRDR
jgi:hypothetical protein